jgi:hypothetical protein
MRMLASSIYNELIQIKEEPKSNRLRLPEHSDPNRFRGTKLDIAGTPAQIRSTSNGGSIIHAIWYNIGGRRYEVVLSPSDDYEITQIRDNAMPSFIKPRFQSEHRQRRESPAHNIFNALKKRGIECKLKGDSVEFLFASHTITVEEETADLSSVKRGLIRSFPLTEKGIEALVARAKKIDDSFDPAKIAV